MGGSCWHERQCFQWQLLPFAIKSAARAYSRLLKRAFATSLLIRNLWLMEYSRVRSLFGTIMQLVRFDFLPQWIISLGCSPVPIRADNSWGYCGCHGMRAHQCNLFNTTIGAKPSYANVLCLAFGYIIWPVVTRLPIDLYPLYYPFSTRAFIGCFVGAPRMPNGRACSGLRHGWFLAQVEVSGCSLICINIHNKLWPYLRWGLLSFLREMRAVLGLTRRLSSSCVVAKVYQGCACAGLLH